jgi:hypothetical protein
VIPDQRYDIISISLQCCTVVWMSPRRIYFAELMAFPYFYLKRLSAPAFLLLLSNFSPGSVTSSAPRTKNFLCSLLTNLHISQAGMLSNALKSPPAIFRSAINGTIGNCNGRVKWSDQTFLGAAFCIYILDLCVATVHVSWEQPLQCGSI